MANLNIRDLNIRYVGHPKYNSKRIVEDRTLEIIIQKLEMLLYTNKGDVFGDPEFGTNLEYLLWSTNVPVEKIKNEIQTQINKYVSELNTYQYKLSVNLFEGTVRDILFINITIKDNEISFVYQ
jgi:phage baseplate assembly protein W